MMISKYNSWDHEPKALAKGEDRAGKALDRCPSAKKRLPTVQSTGTAAPFLQDA